MYSIFYLINYLCGVIKFILKCQKALMDFQSLASLKK